MTDFIEPANSLLLNGYSKRIQGLIQSTKTKIQYGTTYALKNEQINVNHLYFILFFINSLIINIEHHQKNN